MRVFLLIHESEDAGFDVAPYMNEIDAYRAGAERAAQAVKDDADEGHALALTVRAEHAAERYGSALAEYSDYRDEVAHAHYAPDAIYVEESILLGSEQPESDATAMQRKDKFWQADGQACPYCGSEDIYAYGLKSEDMGPQQSVTCEACNKDWTENYTLCDVELYDETDAEADDE